MYFELACVAKRVKNRRKDMLILQGESRRGPKYFEKYCTADHLNLL